MGAALWQRKELIIAILATAGIAIHLVLRYAVALPDNTTNWPLYAVLLLGGIPLIVELLGHVVRLQFGADLLAGIAIVTAVLLGEYLAGALVVLMLSGGETIEALAVRRASSTLATLAARMPSIAHRKVNGEIRDINVADVAVGDSLVVYPHEVCPVDGEVTEGHGVMDESYLTGEPYMMNKTPGSEVLSGSVNGQSALTIVATRLAADSRYAQIMKVMEEAEANRPPIRRLADQLGAWFTPIALILAGAAWAVSGDSLRFLAVLVIATPCPLLIGIPVTIIGAISIAAKRGIIVRDPAALEQIDRVKTLILDKTGTVTFGRPTLTGETYLNGFTAESVFPLVAALEQYSKHPLGTVILRTARERSLAVPEASEVHEHPHEGLFGKVNGRQVVIGGRRGLEQEHAAAINALASHREGLECLVVIDGDLAAHFRFRDTPRSETEPFLAHLEPKHAVNRILLVSGDRRSEVEYVAQQIPFSEIVAEATPERKVDIVTREAGQQPTMFVGDGINDAPALAAATVGVAFGQHSDITSRAAPIVLTDPSLAKIDELIHIGRRMRRIALQSAGGGMILSIIGMVIAAAGYLPPVAGAVTQEIIDLLVVFNAARMAVPPGTISDF